MEAGWRGEGRSRKGKQGGEERGRVAEGGATTTTTTFTIDVTVSFPERRESRRKGGGGENETRVRGSQNRLDLLWTLSKKEKKNLRGKHVKPLFLHQQSLDPP